MRIGIILLSLLLAIAASANISVFKDTLTVADTTTVRFTVNHAIDTITDRIRSCASMEVIFQQSNIARVSLYAVNQDDDTVAEVEAGTLLQAFTASTAAAVSISPGTAEVRFVVDLAEDTGTSYAQIRCSN